MLCIRRWGRRTWLGMVMAGRSKRGGYQRQPTLRERRRAEERRAHQREARHRAMRRALLRRWVIAGLIVTTLGLAGIAAVLVLGQTEPSKVTGRLFGVRDVSFVEGTQGDGGVSPVCGCESSRVDSWRGISFAGRQLTLSRSGTSPWTEWVLSNADPDTIRLQGGTDWLRIHAFRLRVKGAFDPRCLLSPGDLCRHMQVLSESVFGEYRMTLLTRQQLHVSLLGPVPVGAWVPFPGSQVTLSPQQSSFPQEPQLPRMVERYPPLIGWPNQPNHTTQPQAYPVGDFLAPLVIWTSDPNAQMPATPIRAPTQSGVVTALLIDHSSFSTRIAAVPLSSYELAGRRQEDDRYPKRAEGDVFFGRSDGGQVALTVDQPLASAEYDALRRQTAAHPTVWTDVLADSWVMAPVGAVLPALNAKGEAPPEPYRLQERYPPLPLYAGFNVFGPLNRVLFRGVWGNVSVGASDVDLSGSADLELEGVHGLRNADDQELLSAPLATSSQSASLEFRAVGTVKVNGVSQSTIFQQHGVLIGALSAVVSAIGLIIGVLAFLQGMRLFSARPVRA